MKKLIAQTINSKKGLFLLFSLLILMTSVASDVSPSSNTAQIHSDIWLFNTANNHYNRGDWPMAAAYFTAYIERDPDRFLTDRNHKLQVTDAKNYSLNQIYKWEKNLNSCASKLSSSSKSGITASTKGLSGSPPPTIEPIPEKPKSYPIVCRGGGDMSFYFDSNTSVSLNPQLWILYTKGDRGVGSNGEYKHELAPGECAFKDRRISPNEPKWIVILTPEFDPSRFQIGWKEGEVVWGGNESLDYLDILGNDSSKFVTFHVYNDYHDHFIVTCINCADIL